MDVLVWRLNHCHLLFEILLESNCEEIDDSMSVENIQKQQDSTLAERVFWAAKHLQEVEKSQCLKLDQDILLINEKMTVQK